MKKSLSYVIIYNKIHQVKGSENQVETASKILQAQQDTIYCEDFIKENMSFIQNCASKTAGRYIDEGDDVFSEALLAFHNAVIHYEENKGDFYAFAKVCISNRIRDYYRLQGKHSKVIPFSSLVTENDNGQETEFEIEDKNASYSETALEIYSLKEELKDFGIEFFDLPKASPKFKSTRNSCIEIVRHIVNNKELLDYVFKKKVLPSKQLTEVLKFSKKILERHRKYLIMGILIINGNYEILSEYFDPEYRRWK